MAPRKVLCKTCKRKVPKTDLSTHACYKRYFPHSVVSTSGKRKDDFARRTIPTTRDGKPLMKVLQAPGRGLGLFAAQRIPVSTVVKSFVCFGKVACLVFQVSVF